MMDILDGIHQIWFDNIMVYFFYTCIKNIRTLTSNKYSIIDFLIKMIIDY